MKKLVVTMFVAAISLGFTSYAQNTVAPGTTPTTAPVNPNAAEITFEKDLHDFGTIEWSGNGVYDFKFKNTGKEPLIISNAQGSCGCTVPTWPKEPIKPGAEGVIKVSYDTKRGGQPFQKTVTITSNAKTNPKVITIKGTVKEQPKEQTSPEKPVNGAPVETPKN